MSQYFGDMENNKVFQAYKHNYQRMSLLLGIQPAYGVCDLHRGYFTSSFARHLGLKTIEIQHHHAHIASVMAEHGLSKKLIGIAFDGVGLGTDGNIWGGEFFVCSGAEFSRAAHLSYVPICGGDSASKDASLCALCYLLAAGCESTWSDQRETIIKAALRENIGVQKYSSMGRLFDAVSAILGMKMQNSYEGECAIALENAAYVHETEGGSAYPLHFDIIENEELLHIDQLSVIKQIIIGLQDNASVGALALGFHHALSDMVLEVCSRLKKKYGLDTVALSGGVFANRLLLKSCINKLTNHGFGVYLNESVPCNDGGLALGQAYLAALQIKEEGNESCV